MDAKFIDDKAEVKHSVEALASAFQDSFDDEEAMFAALKEIDSFSEYEKAKLEELHLLNEGIVSLLSKVIQHWIEGPDGRAYRVQPYDSKRALIFDDDTSYEVPVSFVNLSKHVDVPLCKTIVISEMTSTDACIELIVHEEYCKVKKTTVEGSSLTPYKSLTDVIDNGEFAFEELVQALSR